MSTVLVTGGSGFVGSHVILQLLAAGHTVRTTVRNLRREPEVREMLKNGGADAGDRLKFFAADLEKDDGWREAVTGCEYVHHVASPIPPDAPKHEDELIIPAREGALRVLRAARDAGVKRVILTSSFASIGHGHPPRTKPYDETDHTNVDGRISSYVKSKTLAERAAFDFVAKEGKGLELSVVNPTAIFGPILGADFSPSIMIIKRMMDGVMKGAPKMWWGIVDVRDVASMHMLCMTVPAAKGERFLCTAGEFITVLEISKILRARMGDKAKLAPTKEFPNFLVRIAALRDQQIRQLLPQLGLPKKGNNAKALRVLGWKPHSNEEAIVAAAESLIKFGLVKN